MILIKGLWNIKNTIAFYQVNKKVFALANLIVFYMNPGLKQIEGKGNEKFEAYVKSIHGKVKNFINKAIILDPCKNNKNTGRRKEIRSIALSPDQATLITGGTDTNIYMFDMKDENANPNVYSVGESIMTVAYSSKGDKILAGTCKGTIVIFDFGKSIEIIKKLETPIGIRTAAFLADGESIIVGGDNGKLRIYGSETDESEFCDIIEHEGGVCSYAYSICLNIYATGGNDNLLKIFTLNEERKGAKNIKTINTHKGMVRALSFSNDGRYLISGSYDKTAKLFDPKTGFELMTYKGHSEPVLAVAISPDSNFILTGSRDNNAIVYDRATGYILYTYNNESWDRYDIRAALFHEGGSKIIIAGEEGVAKVFDIRKNQFIRGHSRHHSFLNESTAINCIDISFDFKTFVTGGDDCMVRLYDLETQYEIRKFEGNEARVNAVRLSPDSKIVLTGGDDCILRLFDVSFGNLIVSFKHHKESIQSIIFTPNGDEFASGSEDKTINIYNYRTREHLDTLPKVQNRSNQDIFIKCMAFSLDGKLIAIGGYDSRHFGRLSLFSRDRKIKKITENIFGQREIIDMELIDNQFLLAVSNTKLNLIDLRDFIDPSKITVLKSISSTDEKKFKFATVRKFDNRNIVLSVSDYKSSSIIHVCDINLKYMEEIFCSNGEFIITTKISFLDSHKIIFGTSIGTPKIANILINQKSDKIERITETYFVEKVENMTIDESGSRLALCTALGCIRIMNLFSGRILEKLELNTILSDIVLQNPFDNNIQNLSGRVKYLKFSNASTLLIGINDGTLIKYDYIQKKMNKNPIRELSNRILQEFYHYMESYFIFCVFKDGSIRIKEIMNEAGGSEPIHILGTKQWRYIFNDNSLILLCPYILHENIKNEGCSNLLALFKDGSLISFDLKHNHASIILNELREPLTCASASNDYSKIIMGGEDNRVRVYDVSTKGQRIFNGHEEKITAVSFLTDKRYAISASEDQIIKVFEIESERELYSYKFDVKINKICVSPVMDTIVLGTDYELRIIYGALTPRSKLDYFYNIGKALEDEKKLKNFDLSVEIKPDSFDLLPVNLDLNLIHLKLVYSKNKIDVLKEVSEILTSRSDDPNSNYHVENKIKEYLCECIFRKDSVHSLSPWNIWVEEANKNKKSEQMIYDNLLEILLCPQMVHIEKMEKKAKFIEKIAQRFPGKLQEVLDIFWKSTDPLTVRMHRMTPSMTIRYYLNILIGVIDIFHLKTKYLKNITLPMVLHTKSPFPCTRTMEKNFDKEISRYFNKDYYDDTDSYFNTFVKISKISLDEIVNLDYFDKNNPALTQSENTSKFLLELLTNFPPEHTVFKSEFLIVLVNYLWRLQECIGFSYYRRLLLFLLFQIIISLNLLYFIPERQASIDPTNSDPPNSVTREFYKNASFISDCLSISILILSFLLKIWKLFKLFSIYGSVKYSAVFSFWNQLDYLIYIMGLSVFSLDIYGSIYKQYDTKTIIWIKCLSALFFATIWFKLIEFARGFSRTSALVRLLYQVTKDMAVYLLIIMFMLFGLTFTAYILQHSYTTNSLWHYFKITYGILIGNSGDFKDEKAALDSELYFILLFFASVYLVIIMLNLLIAIINNSFRNILAKESQNEIYEKLKIINNKIYEFGPKEKQRLRRKIENDFLFQIKQNKDKESSEAISISK